MKGFSFDLFGFDYLPNDSLYGTWLLAVKDWEGVNRSLFCLYYSDGDWRFELFWFRIV